MFAEIVIDNPVANVGGSLLVLGVGLVAFGLIAQLVLWTRRLPPLRPVRHQMERSPSSYALIVMAHARTLGTPIATTGLGLVLLGGLYELIS